MAAKAISMSTLKQIIRLDQQGKGKKEIGRLLSISKNTVKKYLSLLSSLDISPGELLLQDDLVLESMIEDCKPKIPSHRYEQFKSLLGYFKDELSRKHVNRKLLWVEYRKQHSDGYEYAQFCRHLRRELGRGHPSMIVQHEAGDLLYVDFAGSTVEVYDQPEGMKPSKKQLFVATLGYSQMSYVGAVDSQCTEDFIGALGSCLDYFGGVPKGIVPDNLKAAVVKSNRYEPKLNKVLEDFANHYGTTILPARVAKPKDKALVENMVKHVYNQILGPLRNNKFYSLSSLNEALHDKLEDYNTRPFQKRDGSRYSCFESEEKHLLSSLPQYKFEIKKYRRLKVQKNSHVYIGEDNHYYSIPYAFIGRQVRVVYTNSIVNVYFQYKNIASHHRNARSGHYTTKPDHLPSHYNDYKNRSPEYYKKWAATLDATVVQFVAKILSSRQHPEQSYRSCDGIRQLSKKVDQATFINACSIGLSYRCYNYNFIKTIIDNGMAHQQVVPSESIVKKHHQNIRGKQHYQKQ